MCSFVKIRDFLLPTNWFYWYSLFMHFRVFVSSDLGPWDLRRQLQRRRLLNKTILHAKQREWIIFILQSILNTIVVLHTTSLRPFSRLKKDSSQSEKSCYLRLNSTRGYSRFRGTKRFMSQNRPQVSSMVVNKPWFL